VASPAAAAPAVTHILNVTLQEHRTFGEPIHSVTVEST
jgi:hypothetical protein